MTRAPSRRRWCNPPPGGARNRAPPLKGLTEERPKFFAAKGIPQSTSIEYEDAPHGLFALH